MTYYERIYQNLVKINVHNLNYEYYIKPNNNILEIIDELFVNHDVYTKYCKYCKYQCSCRIGKGFFNLMNLPENYFKVIFNYCIEKKYIILDQKIEHFICVEIMRNRMIEDYNINTILWIIENFISSEKLNSFLYDYNYDKDITESVLETEKREYYSLLHTFYFSYHFSENYISIILDLFKQKKFNFKNISLICGQSLLTCAIKKWDFYSLCFFNENSCEFTDINYYDIMYLIRKHIGNLQYEADKDKMPKKDKNGLWDDTEYILYKELLKDDDMLCTIFQPHLLDSKQDDKDEINQELCKKINDYVINKFSHLSDFNSKKDSMILNISTYYGRSFIMPNEKILYEIYQILEYCIKVIKIDLDYKFLNLENDKYLSKLENPNLLNIYMHGSKPIKLIFPEWHIKYVDLLTNKN